MRNIDNDPRYQGTELRPVKRIEAEAGSHAKLAQNGYETLDQAEPCRERKGLNRHVDGEGWPHDRIPDWMNIWRD